MRKVTDARFQKKWKEDPMPSIYMKALISTMVCCFSALVLAEGAVDSPAVIATNQALQEGPNIELVGGGLPSSMMGEFTRNFAEKALR
ncbi:MAG: hypothetical protein AAF202_09020, partial [Pseudomonadota bacterium]